MLSHLQQCEFGYAFNHDLENASVLSCLQQREFGFAVNHDLENVSGPSGLQQLEFGYVANRDLAVSFPKAFSSAHPAFGLRGSEKSAIRLRKVLLLTFHAFITL